MAHQFPKEYGVQYRTEKNAKQQQQRQQQQEQQAQLQHVTSQEQWSLSSLSQQLPHSAASYTSIHPPRSNPIAIRRNRTSNVDTSEDDFDDDDDEDDMGIDVERDAIKIAARLQRLSGKNNVDTTANASKSLPSRLLRAPLLGSVPSNEDYIAYQNMLPPPQLSASRNHHGRGPSGSMAPTAARGDLGFIADNGSNNRVAYGSLRESHMRGRFLDGPSSYRDKQTGDIRRIQHRVRFQDVTTTTASSTASLSSSLPVSTSSSLSIGERLMQQARKRQELSGAAPPPLSSSSLTTTTALNKEEHHPTSSLSAMLEASSLDRSDSADNTTGAAEEKKKYFPREPSSSDYDDFAFYDNFADHNERSNMLSTSLTGLEVLQSLQRPSLSMMSNKRSNNTVEGSSAASMISPLSGSVNGGGSNNDDMGDLPRRDNVGHNTLLSRSFSDPTPQSRRPTTSSVTTSPAMSISSANRTMSPLLLGSDGSNAAIASAANHYRFTAGVVLPCANSQSRSFVNAAAVATTTTATPTSTTYHPSSQPPPSPLQPLPPPSSPSICPTTTPLLYPPSEQQSELPTLDDIANPDEDNPDIEGAFDMDFE